MDKQKIAVTIAGQEYLLVSDEPEAHAHRVAAMVDAEILAVRSASSSLSAAAAVVLASANIADRLIRAQETAESLRAQLKDYLEEVARSKNELAEARRELNKLKRDIK